MPRLLLEARWFISLGLCLGLLAILVTYSKADPAWSHASFEAPKNLGGRFGAYLADLSLYIFGVSAFCIGKHSGLIFSISTVSFLRLIPYLFLVFGSLLGFFSPSAEPILANSELSAIVYPIANLRLLSSICVGFVVSRAISSCSHSARSLLFGALCIATSSILLIQIVNYIMFFALGVPPYGTFQGASFLDFPAFGAVSIERGHLGRIISFFPLIFYSLLDAQRSYSTVVFFAPKQNSLISFLEPFPFHYCWIWISSVSVLFTLSTSAYSLLLVFLFSLLIFRAPSFCHSFLSSPRISPRLLFAFLMILFSFLALRHSLLPVLSKAFSMVFEGQSEVRSFDNVDLTFFGAGFWGSQGRMFLGLNSYDLGVSVSLRYFGVFYPFFIVSMALLSALRAFSSALPLASRGLYVSGAIAVLLFNCFEVSLGQYTAVAAWFLLP
jgi:hypothetical protein